MEYFLRYVFAEFFLPRFSLYFHFPSYLILFLHCNIRREFSHQPLLMLTYKILLEIQRKYTQESPVIFSLDQSHFSGEFLSVDPMITIETDTLYEAACIEGAVSREGHYWRTFVGLETRPELRRSSQTGLRKSR